LERYALGRKAVDKPTLFKRGDSPNYWARFSIAGQGQIRIALGTDDEAEAQRLAQKEYERAIVRAEEGLLAVRSSFEKVAREYIAELKAEVLAGTKKPYVERDYPPVIERYFIPFFGKKAIDGITSGDIHRYQVWRQTYWISGPGAETKHIEYIRGGKKLYRPVKREAPTSSRMRGEASLLRQLFNFAAKHDYIRSGKVPLVESARLQSSPRPSFDQGEIEKLLDLSQQRLSALDISGETRRDRIKLDCYINIAVFTGMRPTELKNLNWGDILRFRETVGKSLGERLESDVVIRASGKKSKHSNIVAMKSVRPFLDTLWQMFEDDTGRPPNDDSPVFAGADGKRIESFKKGLTNLLTAADLLFDRSGNRRSAYSFRHFYIKRQLLADVDVFTVAINTRTSVEMIQKFYVPEITPEHRAASLNPKWDS
jgi:integrase